MAIQKQIGCMENISVAEFPIIFWRIVIHLLLIHPYQVAQIMRGFTVALFTVAIQMIRLVLGNENGTLLKNGIKGSKTIWITQLALFRNLNTISKCWYRSNWKCTLQYNSGSFATITYYNTNFEPENRKRWVGGRSQFSTNLHQSKETSLWVSCYKSSRNKSDLNCRKKKVDKDINDIQCFDLLHNENKCFLQKNRIVWIIDNLLGL